LALFGSVQRNAARPDSDVDVLVEFQPGEKTYDHFLALGDLLERLFSRRVELVTPESSGLSKFERGRERTMGDVQLARIARILRLGLEDLVSGTDHERK
jgi:predicted nucleotidyltransferase